jgi:hypothetical protein
VDKPNLSDVGRVFTLGTFGEALEALKQGLRVRRASWPENEALELYVPGGAYSDRGYKSSVPTIYERHAVTCSATHYLAYQDDLLARDWQTA